jgi:hypothetical protein
VFTTACAQFLGEQAGGQEWGGNHQVCQETKAGKDATVASPQTGPVLGCRTKELAWSWREGFTPRNTGFKVDCTLKLQGRGPSPSKPREGCCRHGKQEQGLEDRKIDLLGGRKEGKEAKALPFYGLAGS